MGVKVNGIIKDSAKILGGGGGGRPNLAQGAGPNSNKIEDALEFALSQIKDIISNHEN
jgi:alanyl-tRNA synthetase